MEEGKTPSYIGLQEELQIDCLDLGICDSGKSIPDMGNCDIPIKRPETGEHGDIEGWLLDHTETCAR
jgi:hypothetical protein